MFVIHNRSKNKKKQILFRNTWSQFNGKEDTYSRIDYLLLSPGMAREWVTDETYVLTLPNWATGSDHRPLVATFAMVDK